MNPFSSLYSVRKNKKTKNITHKHFVIGNYACDLTVTKITYSAVVYLRNNLVRFWYDVYNLVNGQCHNIMTRKYYRNNDRILTDCMLDITLMPLPALQVMYPQLR